LQPIKFGVGELENKELNFIMKNTYTKKLVYKKKMKKKRDKH